MDEQFVRNRISELLYKKDRSERDLSLELGHSPSYINGITSGNKMPSIKELLNICDCLNITPEEFFHEETENCELSKEKIELINLLSNIKDDIIILISELIRVIQKT